MGAMLDALNRLQQIDQQLRSTQESIQAKHRTVLNLERKAKELEKQIEQVHLQARQAQAEADRQELDRKAREQHIAKMREALNKAKTNKEYSALLAELNTEKADSMKLEDVVLTAMGKVEEYRKQETSLKDALAAQKQRIEDARRIARETEAQLASRVADLEKQRSAACVDVPGEIMMMFNRAADQNDGDALAAVQRTHPKRAEYICGGCNMGIPLEIINLLQTRGEIKQCNTCLRILYLESQVSASV